MRRTKHITLILALGLSTAAFGCDNAGKTEAKPTDAKADAAKKTDDAKKTDEAAKADGDAAKADGGAAAAGDAAAAGQAAPTDAAAAGQAAPTDAAAAGQAAPTDAAAAGAAAAGDNPLVGAWTIDKEGFKDVEAYKTAPPEQQKMMDDMFAALTANLTFAASEFELGVVVGAETNTMKGTYTVKSNDGTKITIESTVDGKTEEVSFTVENGKLVMTQDGQTLVFKKA